MAASGRANASSRPDDAGAGNVDLQRSKSRIDFPYREGEGVFPIFFWIAAHVETGKQRMKSRACHAHNLRRRKQCSHGGKADGVSQRRKQCFGVAFANRNCAGLIGRAAQTEDRRAVKSGLLPMVPDARFRPRTFPASTTASRARPPYLRQRPQTRFACPVRSRILIRCEFVEV